MDKKSANSKNLDSDFSTKDEQKSLLNEDKGKQEEKRYNKETILGLVFSFLAVLLTALSKICVQAVKADVPHFFLNTLRCSTATAGMVLVLLYTCQLPRVEYVDLKPTALYCISCTLYGLSVYIPVVYIPLVTQEACTITALLLSSLIIFGLIKKEHVRIDQVSFNRASSGGGGAPIGWVLLLMAVRMVSCVTMATPPPSPLHKMVV